MKTLIVCSAIIFLYHLIFNLLPVFVSSLDLGFRNVVKILIKNLIILSIASIFLGFVIMVFIGVGQYLYQAL